MSRLSAIHSASFPHISQRLVSSSLVTARMTTGFRVPPGLSMPHATGAAPAGTSAALGWRGLRGNGYDAVAALACPWHAEVNWEGDCRVVLDLLLGRKLLRSSFITPVGRNSKRNLPRLPGPVESEAIWRLGTLLQGPDKHPCGTCGIVLSYRVRNISRPGG